MGKVPKLSTVVTLSLPPDAQNETPTINITGIVMDAATAGWKCEPCALCSLWHGPPMARPAALGRPWAVQHLLATRADLYVSCLRLSSPAGLRAAPETVRCRMRCGAVWRLRAPFSIYIPPSPAIYLPSPAPPWVPPIPGRCRPTVRDNCTCVPNAALLSPASFLVMPLWRRFTLPGPVVDTTFQVG